MNEHTLRVLEFDSVLSLLKEFATSDLGKSLCESLRPKRDIKEIKSLLDEVSELKEVLQVYGDIPIDGIRDIEACVTKTRVEGFILETTEFLDVLSTLKAAHRLKGFFEKLKDDRRPLLKEMGRGFVLLPDLQCRIEQTVGPGGDILDSAGSELREIRETIKRLRIKIQKSLEDLLVNDSLHPFVQERVITIRNGRYVIPVKSGFKGHVHGIIHDQSHSKATCFIEPICTIEMNNELGLFLKEEKNEELRILKSLSSRIQEDSQEILTNLELLGKVDLTYAKARYSIELNANKPLLNKDGRVSFVNAYHPRLLSFESGKKDVVPIDIHVNKGCSVLIITGANTGGKTVALKTLGILTLMVQAGMHICVADHSEAAIFDSIFADIGDEQDMEQSLSAFSSHISRIVEILDKADGSSLVLLDEIGVGTDPDEGAALAMALLDYLREKGSRIVATTHLNQLKAYAYRSEDVANVSVEFDPETMEPRYSLIYGTSGESNALAIAETLGIRREIIDKALGYVEDGGGGSLIRALETAQREIIEEKREIKRLKEIALAFQQEVESLAEKIRAKREGILLETEAKAKALLKRTEDEAREIVRDLKRERKQSAGGFEKRFRHLKEEVESFSPNIVRKPIMNNAPINLKRGDIVRINALRKEGVVVRAQKGSDQVEVLVGSLKVKVRANELEQASGKTLKDAEIRTEISFAPITTGKTERINAVGMRVFDALPLIDKALDNAMLSGATNLDIVHGVGAGRLREAIQTHLRTHRLVANFDSADLSHGGVGVTVVEIRD